MNTFYLMIDPERAAYAALGLRLSAMSLPSDFNWFAIQCRSGTEAQVDFNLRTMFIESDRGKPIS
jgi:hypothetical protein